MAAVASVVTRGHLYRATVSVSSALCRPVTRFATEKSIYLTVPRVPVIEIGYSRELHTGSIRYGLDEFFQKGEDLIEDAEKTGRPWLPRELRHKSSEDLHKLWYVLLKERNMLLTQQHEATRQGFIMPAPERMKKVRVSMARIKLVIGERNKAVREAREFLKSQEESNEPKVMEYDEQSQSQSIG